jgi:hypothetical protein
MARKQKTKADRLYVETVGPDALVLTDSPTLLDGHRVVLDRRDVAVLLSVLDGTFSICTCAKGELSLAHHTIDSSANVDYTASFDDGSKVEFGAFDARVLRYALRAACLELCRTRV